MVNDNFPISDGLTLFSYWRSSAAYRARIALNLKGLAYHQIPIHLVRDGGEQHLADYARVNPQQLVPTLRDGERVVRQSLAIIEYLDEAYEGPALLPDTARSRARVRALAHMVACDIHPLANLRVLQYLTGELGVTETAKLAWIQHWITTGFDAFETLLAGNPETGDFCEGELPGLADCTLIPQVYNARRFDIDLTPYPNIVRIEQHCLTLPAFADAVPEAQPDAA